MPSYHSVFNAKEDVQKYCGIPALEFKEKKTPTLDATIGLKVFGFILSIIGGIIIGYIL